jgi:hypothetical protein
MQAFYALKLRDTIKGTPFVRSNDRMNNKQDRGRGSNSDSVGHKFPSSDFGFELNNLGK